MYRGRLIWQHIAELALLDTDATETGPPSPGYDPDFHEPVRVPDASARGSHSSRVETLLQLPCQVMVTEYGTLQQTGGGPMPAGKLQLTFHYKDLEIRGLVDVKGDVSIHVGDRLHRVLTVRGEVIHEFSNPPGLWAVKVQPQSYGLDAQTRNLLVVDFDDREQSTRE
jgi:hypothetical protein